MRRVVVFPMVPFPVVVRRMVSMMTAGGVVGGRRCGALLGETCNRKRSCKCENCN
jgi:hypothetical protein